MPRAAVSVLSLLLFCCGSVRFSCIGPRSSSVHQFVQLVNRVVYYRLNSIQSGYWVLGTECVQSFKYLAANTGRCSLTFKEGKPPAHIL